MIENPREHFHSKIKLALEEIEDDSPLLILLFNEPGKCGILFLRKTQNKNRQTEAIEINGQPRIIIAATGKYLDFRKFMEWLRIDIQESIDLYCQDDIGTDYVLREICLHLNYIFQNGARALALEIIFISRLEHPLKMYRIKSDGEYHAVNNFAVLGGRKKFIRGKISLRKKALEILGQRYADQPPSREEAEEIGRKLLALDSHQGEIQVADLTTRN